MFVVCVTIHLKPEFVQRFLPAILDNARGTRREPGNVRFDVLVGEEDPARFMLYEVYKTRDAFVEHQQTEHYLRWKSLVADWMAQPRVGLKHRTVFFGDEATYEKAGIRHQASGIRDQASGMIRFDFFSVVRIVFGRGQVARLGELAAAIGRSALVISNAGELGAGGPSDRVMGLLGEAGVKTGFFRQRGEPTTADVERGVGQARAGGCDVLIGLGGGSAIDCAKAVAAVLANGGSPVDYLEVVGKGRRISRPAVPWIAVPTTAGTGAEVTRNAVIGLAEKQFKASIRSELMLARAAVVDSELGVSVRPEVTARAGMDALCQLIESYTSSGASPMTDALAIKGIGLAARSLRRVYANGGDLDGRDDMALAALLGGMTLTNAGLGAVHGLAAPLGASFPIPHGTICAALLPHVIAANVAALRAQAGGGAAGGRLTLARYAAVGKSLAGKWEMSDADAIDGAARFTADLAGDLHIPPLRSFGLAESDVPAQVALARKSSSMRYNPVTLSDEALAEALRKAL